MSPTEHKLQELADAVRDMAAADSEVGVAKATVTICWGPICVELPVDQDDIDAILEPIDIEGIIKKWKKSHGIPQ